MNVTDQWMLERMQQMAANMAASLPQVGQSTDTSKPEKGDSFKDLMDKAKDTKVEAPKKDSAVKKNDATQKTEQSQTTKIPVKTDGKTVMLTAEEAAMVAAGYAALSPVMEDGTVWLAVFVGEGSAQNNPLVDRILLGEENIVANRDFSAIFVDEWVVEPTPELKTGSPQVIKSVCTPDQKRIVMELAERAEAIRNGVVDSSQDNFLKLTHEARLLSIDPRAIDPEIPDDPGTKLNLCAGKVAKIYQETAADRLTQLIFCDQGTPKYDGSFNFYEAAKTALIAQGVRAEEITFIHDAKTDVQREQLFEKVRKGEIRILMGSTEKMGTGMNVQEKLIALHHLDVPWRPADLTQRNGRILRQGNENREVSIFNYITENTFDSYLWQILEQKQRYISQIMTGRSPLRTCEDLDETVLQYAEFKALATSDPRVKEKMETDNEINRLTVLKSSWQSQQAQRGKAQQQDQQDHHSDHNGQEGQNDVKHIGDLLYKLFLDDTILLRRTGFFTAGFTCPAKIDILLFYHITAQSPVQEANSPSASAKFPRLPPRFHRAVGTEGSRSGRSP